MKLQSYLDNQNLNAGKFARMIGVTQQAVDRYLKGQRRPRKDIMPKIKETTQGAVTADDFW